MIAPRLRFATIFAGVLSAAWGARVSAQSPFLFAAPPAIGARIVAAFDAGYNARAFEPVAGERLEPRGSVAMTLSPLFSIQGSAAVASTLDHRTRLSDQFELGVTPLRTGALAFGSSVGMRHEYSGASVALVRAVGARMTQTSAFGADVLLEHPLVSGRDAVDIVTTIGASRALTSRLWLGVEAVGSDLEGLWDREEAEGGATVLIGPTLAVSVLDHWRLVVGGGPVLRASTDRTMLGQVASPSAINSAGRAGYVLRTSLRRSW